VTPRRPASVDGPLVAMVLQSYPPVLGGAQRQVRQLAPLLADRGVRVHVITRRVPGTPGLAQEPGATVERLHVPAPGPAASAAFVAGASRRLVALRPDVIHAFDLLSPSLAALLASSVTGAPVVAKVLSTGSGGDLDRLRSKRSGRIRARLIAGRFAAWHAVSADVEVELRQLGADPGAIARIANGVDCLHFRPLGVVEKLAARRRLGLAPDEFVTLYCGRLAPVKRLELLVAAVRHAPGVLVLVGEGPQEPLLRRQANEAGVASRVRFLPAVDDPAAIYGVADAYVSTSATEGMSNSVLEAMASGLPILATRASGMAELLAGGAGLLLERAGPVELGTQLRRLAGDGALRERLGLAARSTVLEHHALPEVADQLARLYRRLAEPTPPLVRAGGRPGPAPVLVRR
jgi:glycosyltransferase involved in cell wall biosynthesis